MINRKAMASTKRLFQTVNCVCIYLIFHLRHSNRQCMKQFSGLWTITLCWGNNYMWRIVTVFHNYVVRVCSYDRIWILSLNKKFVLSINNKSMSKKFKNVNFSFIITRKSIFILKYKCSRYLITKLI